MKRRRRIDSFIGSNTHIDGDLFFLGVLHVEGRICGNVHALPGESSSTLVVGKHARIDGKVMAPHLVVNGVIDGQVVGLESLQLCSGARVSGDVRYKFIEVQPGAIVEGLLAKCATDEPMRAGESNIALGA